jgi:hypothetical protein
MWSQCLSTSHVVAAVIVNHHHHHRHHHHHPHHHHDPRNLHLSRLIQASTGNCRAGLTGICLTVNPARPGAAYGYANTHTVFRYKYNGFHSYVDMGGWIGGQADYVMVPFADFNLLRLGRDPAQAMDKILVCSPCSCPFHPFPSLLNPSTRNETFRQSPFAPFSFTTPNTTPAFSLTPTAKRLHVFLTHPRRTSLSSATSSPLASTAASKPASPQVP